MIQNFLHEDTLFLSPNSFRLSHIKTGYSVFLNSCRRLKPSYSGWISAPVKSTAKSHSLWCPKEKRDLMPPLKAKGTKSFWASSSRHGRASPAALPKPATAPCKEGLRSELFGRKGRKPKEEYFKKFCASMCRQNLTIWRHGRNTNLMSCGSKQAWLGFCS